MGFFVSAYRVPVRGQHRRPASSSFCREVAIKKYKRVISLLFLQSMANLLKYESEFAVLLLRIQY